MADDYRSARWRKCFDGPKSDTTKKDGPGKDNRRCHICQQEGHIAANCKEKGKQPNDSGAKKEHGRDQFERRCFNCHQRGHMETSGSQGSGGRAVEGQGGAGGGASDGVLGSTESGGDTGDSGGCVEERKQVGEVNGGDGGGGHGEQDKGRQEASWECVEDGKMDMVVGCVWS